MAGQRVRHRRVLRDVHDVQELHPAERHEELQNTKCGSVGRRRQAGEGRRSELEQNFNKILFLFYFPLPFQYDEGHGSILDRDTESKAILKIAGREIHSDGYREMNPHE